MVLTLTTLKHISVSGQWIYCTKTRNTCKSEHVVPSPRYYVNSKSSHIATFYIKSHLDTGRDIPFVRFKHDFKYSYSRGGLFLCLINYYYCWWICCCLFCVFVCFFVVIVVGFLCFFGVGVKGSVLWCFFVVLFRFCGFCLCFFKSQYVQIKYRAILLSNFQPIITR